MVERCAEPPHIARGVGARTPQDLGRQVGQRARDLAPIPQRCKRTGAPVHVGSLRGGHAKIEQRGPRTAQHDVGWLQIAVDDAVRVGVGQRVSQLVRDRQQLTRRDGTAPDARLQRLAVETLHDEVVDARVVPDVVERADVRMLEVGDHPGFTLEAFPPIGIGRRIAGEDLDGDRAAETKVARFVDLTHAPDAEEAEDFVDSEATARGETHDCRDSH